MSSKSTSGFNFINTIFKTMKRFFAILAALVSLPFLSTADDHAIPFAQLPQTSQTFVQTHFKGVNVVLAMRDFDSYEVRFEDGTEIEFDRSGNWKEIDCKYKAVPASVVKLIPAGIKSYVSSNFPQAEINQVNVKRWGYEVELNNGLELDFNKNGGFLRMDD